MKGRLAVDVFAVYFDFVVCEESNHFVDVVFVNGLEEQVVTNFFDSANHFKN